MDIDKLAGEAATKIIERIRSYNEQTDKHPLVTTEGIASIISTAIEPAITQARADQREQDAKIVAGGFPQDVHIYTEQVLAAIRGGSNG